VRSYPNSTASAPNYFEQDIAALGAGEKIPTWRSKDTQKYPELYRLTESSQCDYSSIRRAILIIQEDES
jgi:hypothetical protein